MINDDIILNYFKFLMPLFKYIHPNYITIFGIYLNFLIFKKIQNNQINQANILLVIRFFCDVFDGAVARKFNKTSKFGGLLDSLSDNILTFIYLYIILFHFTKNKSLSIKISFLYILFNFIYIIKVDGLFDHTNLTNSDNNIKILKFFVKNTWVLFTLSIIFNNYFLKK